MKRNASPIPPWGAEDAALRRMSAALFVLAALSLAYDVVSLASGPVDLNRHLPFLFPFVLTLFGIFCRKASRSRKLPGNTGQAADEYDRSSCLHPDNHPKGRRDAPDGTSD